MARVVDGPQAQVAERDHFVVGQHEVVGGQHRGIVGGDADVDPGVTDRLDRLDVIPVSVGREHPTDTRGLADLEEQLVFVGGVDDDRVAGALASDDKDVVLERTDDQLLDPDRRGLVVGGTRHRPRLPGRPPAWPAPGVVR